MSNAVSDLSEEELTRALAYAGFVLLAYELVKSLIVNPIKAIYENTTFDSDLFKSYEVDVLSRDRNEFEACLLYLRDFIKAIDSDDVLAIQGLRKHRNDLAHDLVNSMSRLDIGQYAPLLEKTDKVLFKLSKHQTYIEIGQDPYFRDKGIDWGTVKGHEYLIFEEVVKKVRILQRTTP